MMKITTFAIFITVALLAVNEASFSKYDDVVVRCVRGSRAFAARERKYISNNQPARDEPSPIAPPDSDFVQCVYEKEKQQRPFECIADRTNATQTELELSPKYRRLVSRCKGQQKKPVCDPVYPYRTFDGTCNNLIRTRIGSLFACMRRVVEANYRGVAGFRKSVCGTELPAPRYLSLQLHRDINRPDPTHTHMMPFFGQFLAHDISNGPPTTIDGEIIECCLKQRDQHPQCAEILPEKDDPFYSMFNITCFNVVRFSLCDTCSVEKRRPMNLATSFIDLSQTYGFKDYKSNELIATDESGKLKVQENRESGDLMPRQLVRPERCGDVRKGEYCFVSGDNRVNQHTPLIGLHTVFFREHNRIATELSRLNPHWRGEKLFQEARRINIAQYQNIVFKEHVLQIVGPELMDKYSLWVADEGTTRYDPSADANLLVEFSGAAYRLHTLINKVVTDYEVYDDKRLFRNMSLEPAPLYYSALSSLMQGVSLSPSQTYDRFVARDLTDFLYKRPSGNYGFDIAAFNIMRGRDLGLPTYGEMVRFMSKGRIEIKNFDNLNHFMNQENIDILRSVYCDVRDIDLWVGLMNELVPEDRVVGPTAAIIIAYQMHQLKFGDRFYFEHSGNFNGQQLRSIRQASLSGILCSTTDIQQTQLQAAEIPSATNPIRKCEDIPTVDLALWKEF